MLSEKKMTTATQLPEGVKLEDLLRLYEREKRYKDAKKAFYASDEGKEYARQKAKLFYQRHKEQILAKRKERYDNDDAFVLLNRAKQYYAEHAEEINEKNRERRKKQKEETK